MKDNSKDIMRILLLLRKVHSKTMLESFREFNPFQNLVATVMSARTKDSTTIPIARRLFKKYKKPEDFVKVPIRELEKEIYGIGFYKVKARNIKKLSKELIRRFGGKVPSDIEELLSLPGVGRKTANCVRCYVFKEPCIPVDIHVHRISNRIGLVRTKTPEETERELMKKIDKKYWLEINELFVSHGQNICLPRRPLCEKCPITKYCDYYRKIFLRYG